MNVHSSVDTIVDVVAYYAIWIAGSFVLDQSSICSLLPYLLNTDTAPSELLCEHKTLSGDGILR